MEKLRIFVSYAHDDQNLVRRIIDALKENGMEPIWDQDLQPGRGFDDQIRAYIAHAHVFMPVITPAASARGWVHQEIGYALGLNVPVMPACIDQLPGAMMQRLQAIAIDADSDFAVLFLERAFANATRYSTSSAHYACAAFPDDRARMLAEYAAFVSKIGYHGHVRQLGGLSSFHIPNRRINDPEWTFRYGLESRSAEHRTLLLAERNTLMEHALQEGCSLIVNPDLDFAPLGPDVRSIRIWELIQFLESMPDDKVRVVFDRSLDRQSVHIVGDWFLAESHAADVRHGYKQTIFTRHAPTVRARAAEFDKEFDDLLDQPGNDSCPWRLSVIAALKTLPGVSSTPPEFMVRRSRALE